MTKSKLVIILGPTASGKSDMAVQVAKRFGGEVISADSRQVYKGLDIGTGKITTPEMRGVKHHLLDVVSPRKQFSVAEYVDLTTVTIATVVNKKKLPVICGGTGYYIGAALGEINIPEVKPNLILRKQLVKKSVSELFEILQKLDSRRAKNIDQNNPRRLIRAIEIVKTLGKVPKLKSKSKNFDVLKIGIKIEDQKLKKRINERLKKRMKAGMIGEAKRLHTKGLSFKRMRELGLEYRRLADYLEHKISKPKLISLLQNEIWQYAKRQKTWFKRDKSIIWLPPNISKIKSLVSKFLSG